MEAIDGKTLNRDGWLARLLLNILQSFIVIDAEEMEDTKTDHWLSRLSIVIACLHYLPEMMHTEHIVLLSFFWSSLYLLGIIEQCPFSCK